MLQPEALSSPQNPKIKHVWSLLNDNAYRKKHNQLVAEGKRECDLALKGGWQPIGIFHCPEIAPNLSDVWTNNQAKVYTVSRAIYEKLAYRKTTEGLLAWFEGKTHALDDLMLGETPLILVLEAVEKPGNLGAILRTADAAGVDALIVCDRKADLHHPNVIRSSIGCAFTVPVALSESSELQQWLAEKNIAWKSATLSTQKSYTETDLSGPLALVFGTEATGLSTNWLKPEKNQITIPMRGQIDSLNVSAACAVLTFEAVRQRRP
jgi:TrmH family RNA methyltransferase